MLPVETHMNGCWQHFLFIKLMQTNPNRGRVNENSFTNQPWRRRANRPHREAPRRARPDWNEYRIIMAEDSRVRASSSLSETNGVRSV